ncbi:hypothetical protein N657DRAFT_206540 [Parathielavia appendiculata]|uniref:Uncharacterized protein n=1 Tax=Parathielavia appendiculata TaxID=2587402 RepID=A0AAN6Z6Z3_9PEZI|nr:hypothetical protein N657DRAFT_206540 [Parathielavia appendiculata]
MPHLEPFPSRLFRHGLSTLQASQTWLRPPSRKMSCLKLTLSPLPRQERHLPEAPPSCQARGIFQPATISLLTAQHNLASEHMALHGSSLPFASHTGFALTPDGQGSVIL